MKVENMPHSAVLTLMEEWLLIIAWWGCGVWDPEGFGTPCQLVGLMRRTCCLSLEEMEVSETPTWPSLTSLGRGVWDTCHNLMWGEV